MNQFNTPGKPETNGQDETFLKDVILKNQEWWGIVWSRKVRIISFSLIVGIFSALYTNSLIKPSYTASYKLFFEEESGDLSGAMRLASSFGFGGMVGGSASSSATVKEFLTSRNNIARAMTNDLENGRLIDRYYAQVMKFNKEFALEYIAMFDNNQRYTDSVITALFKTLNKNHLSAVFDEETGTLDFAVTGEDEAFTFDLANSLVQSAEEQFKNWKREKKKSAVKAFQNKIDSLEVRIDQSLFFLGEFEDQNIALVSSVDKMKRMRLTIDLESLKVAYGEYLKALEISKIELMNLEAPFKYFDKPTYPILKEEASAAKAGIYGSFITGFILVLFFIVAAELRNIMSD